jgi:hypothetical protein
MGQICCSEIPQKIIKDSPPKIMNQAIDIYEKQISSCKEETFSSGVVYKGHLNKEKLRHGIGKLIWPNNSYYIGNFKNNVCCGHGVLVLNEDEFNEGEWENDQLNGTGLITMRNYTYCGDFLNGVPHGNGEIFYTEGGKYNGGFFNGMKQGEGTLTVINFNYKGHFDQDCMSGYGVCEWNDGRKYEGYWENNKMEGRGRFFWADGSLYEGEYEKGLKNGFGILKGIDGQIICKGYWLKGKFFKNE